MSGTSGALSSLVMTLPLIAVPCLAVFGLPSLGPATADADADAAVMLGESSPDAPDAPARPDASARPDADAADFAAAATPFGGIVDAAGSTGPAPASRHGFTDRSEIDPTSDRRAAAANMAAGLDPPAAVAESFVRTADGKSAGSNPFAELADAGRSASPGNTPASQPPGSWGEAVARLNTLGVHDFRVTTGEAAGSSHFSCALPIGTQTVRRFEAEAADPLAAMHDVLVQIEQFQRSR